MGSVKFQARLLAFFLLSLGVPLWSVRHRLWREPYSGILFTCLGLLALYAWVEFPFANPAVALSAATAFFCAVRHLQLGSDTDRNSRQPV